MLIDFQMLPTMIFYRVLSYISIKLVMADLRGWGFKNVTSLTQSLADIKV